MECGHRLLRSRIDGNTWELDNLLHSKSIRTIKVKTQLTCGSICLFSSHVASKSRMSKYRKRCRCTTILASVCTVVNVACIALATGIDGHIVQLSQQLAIFILRNARAYFFARQKCATLCDANAAPRSLLVLLYLYESFSGTIDFLSLPSLDNICEHVGGI